MDTDIKVRLRALTILYLLIAIADDDFQQLEAEQILLKLQEWIPDISEDDLVLIIDEAQKLLSEGDQIKLFNSSAEIINKYFDEDNKVHVLKDLTQIAMVDGDLSEYELAMINSLITNWDLAKKVDLEDYVKYLTTMKEVERLEKEKEQSKEQEELENSESVPDYYNNSTNTKYPGEFYFLTKEYSERPIKIKNFPGVDNVDELFRKFSSNEVEAIKNKIESERIIPVLVFVKEILESKVEMDVKEPFWFIPFILAAENTGCFLYFEQNGFYGNFEKADELKMIIHVDAIEDIDIYSGFDEDESKYEDSIKTIRVETNKGHLTISEFFGNGFGSQLEIINSIWYLWLEVVEYNREYPHFAIKIPNGPTYKVFHSWDEVIDWAQEENEAEPIEEGEVELPNEVIAEVFKSGANYRAVVKGTKNDITEIIDNPAKLQYAFERSGLVKGKKDKEGNFKWRVMG